MNKYNDLSHSIIKNVGGKKNIINVTHCMTRLRFELKDISKASIETLKTLPGVLTSQEAGGRVQVVIGNEVSNVYDEIINIIGLEKKEKRIEEKQEEKSMINRMTDTITKVFTPVLGVLAAGGLIKGILALLVSFSLVQTTDGAYHIFTAIGDALFYFFPIILGYTSAEAFGLNKILGAIIGACLVYPGMIDALKSGNEMYTMFGGTMFETPVTSTFLGIPLLLPSNGYVGTVIPVIAAVYFASKLNKLCKKYIPEIIGFTLTPFIVLLVTVVMTIIVIGPIAHFAELIISNLTLSLYAFNPILAALIIALIYQPLVVFGLHWPLIAIAIANYGIHGYDYIFAMVFTANFAQTAVVLAVLAKSKDPKMKSIAIPAIISGLMCIIEPAMYGVTLKQKKRFINCCISAAIGGMIITAFSLNMYVAVSGVLGFIAFITPEGDMFGMYIAIIATLVSMVFSFVWEYFTFKEDSDYIESINKSSTEILSPLSGKVIALEEVNDPTFSSKVLGEGLAIIPDKGEVIAPFDGTISALFNTGHAIGITSEDGVEVLIHVGINTVQLDGKYFEKLVHQGDKVKQGQSLIKFDIPAIESENYSLESPIIITNSNSYNSITLSNDTDIDTSKCLMEIA